MIKILNAKKIMEIHFHLMLQHNTVKVSVRAWI